METTYISAKDTAKLARQALRKAFPGVKFSVRCSTTSSLNIEWRDGPTREAVEKVTSCFSYGRFDGMIDMGYSVSHWLLPDESVILAHNPGTIGSAGVHEAQENPAPEGAKLVKMGCRFVFQARIVSAPLYTQALCGVCTQWGSVPDDVYVTESDYDLSGQLSRDVFIENANEWLATLVHRQLSSMEA